MKKIISLFLALCIFLVSMPVAFATDLNTSGACDDPVIYIGGDSSDIY